MTMKYEQWKEILSAVNEEEGLSKDNIVKKIKEKLKVENEDEYRKWKGDGFSVNHLFQVTFSGEKHTLLHLAAREGHTKIVKILIEKGADSPLKNKNGKKLSKYVAQFAKEKEQKQAEKNAGEKGIFAGCSTALLGTAVAVALFATGTIAVEPISIIKAIAIVTAAAFAAGRITYEVSKPSTKVDGAEEEKTAGDGREVPS